MVLTELAEAFSKSGEYCSRLAQWQTKSPGHEEPLRGLKLLHLQRPTNKLPRSRGNTGACGLRTRIARLFNSLLQSPSALPYTQDLPLAVG